MPITPAQLPIPYVLWEQVVHCELAHLPLCLSSGSLLNRQRVCHHGELQLHLLMVVLNLHEPQSIVGLAAFGIIELLLQLGGACLLCGSQLFCVLSTGPPGSKLLLLHMTQTLAAGSILHLGTFLST